MTFVKTISPTIKYTFTYSEQTVSFLDVQFTFLNPENSRQNSLKNQRTAWLLHFHSHHPLSCKKGNIYSQALRYNMIISEDHILLEELNNVARILLARAYPLHLIIKSIKKPWPTTQLPVIPTNTTDRNQHSPIVTPFSDIAKLTAANIHKNWHTITICLSKPLSFFTKSSSIHNHLIHSARRYGS